MAVDRGKARPYCAALKARVAVSLVTCIGWPKRKCPMKVRNSLKSLKNRHRDCRVVRRKGRVYVINKTNRRFKARQG